MAYQMDFSWTNADHGDGTSPWSVTIACTNSGTAFASGTTFELNVQTTYKTDGNGEAHSYQNSTGSFTLPIDTNTVNTVKFRTKSGTSAWSAYSGSKDIYGISGPFDTKFSYSSDSSTPTLSFDISKASWDVVRSLRCIMTANSKLFDDPNDTSTYTQIIGDVTDSQTKNIFIPSGVGFDHYLYYSIDVRQAVRNEKRCPPINGVYYGIGYVPEANAVTVSEAGSSTLSALNLKIVGTYYGSVQNITDSDGTYNIYEDQSESPASTGKISIAYSSSSSYTKVRLIADNMMTGARILDYTSANATESAVANGIATFSNIPKNTPIRFKVLVQGSTGWSTDDESTNWYRAIILNKITTVLTAPESSDPTRYNISWSTNAPLTTFDNKANDTHVDVGLSASYDGVVNHYELPFSANSFTVSNYHLNLYVGMWVGQYVAITDAYGRESESEHLYTNIEYTGKATGGIPWTDPYAAYQKPVHGFKVYEDADVADASLRIADSWEDWHLVPTSRPVINPPEVKTSYVEIPGANGKLDLTESLNDYITYGNRTGSMEFIVITGYMSWEQTYAMIVNRIHGKKVRLYLDDDKGWFYTGRISVNEWKSDKSYSTITFDYDLYPYKHEVLSSDNLWPWSGSFEANDIENNIVNRSVSNTENLIIYGGYEPQVMTITVDSVAHGGSMLTLKNGMGYKKSIQITQTGKQRIPQFVLTRGLNTLSASKELRVTIPVRRGSL